MLGVETGTLLDRYPTVTRNQHPTIIKHRIVQLSLGTKTKTAGCYNCRQLVCVGGRFPESFHNLIVEFGGRNIPLKPT